MGYKRFVRAPVRDFDLTIAEQQMEKAGVVEKTYVPDELHDWYTDKER